MRWYIPRSSEIFCKNSFCVMMPFSVSSFAGASVWPATIAQRCRRNRRVHQCQLEDTLVRYKKAMEKEKELFLAEY
jgi:hypothetical protein